MIVRQFYLIVVSKKDIELLVTYFVILDVQMKKDFLKFFYFIFYSIMVKMGAYLFINLLYDFELNLCDLLFLSKDCFDELLM